MTFTRYVRSTDPPPAGLTLASAWARVRELPDGSVLLRCRFRSAEDLRTAQNVAGLTVLPSLQTPAARLPQAVKDWLAARGVILDPGDTVLNAVRKLRDLTSRGPGDFFDVSLSE